MRFIMLVMEAGLKIISLNIEKDKNLFRVIPFLKAQQADVILLQEVFTKDIPFLEEKLGMKSIFAGMLNLRNDNSWALCGVATFSKLTVLNSNKEYYARSEEDIPF